MVVGGRNRTFVPRVSKDNWCFKLFREWTLTCCGSVFAAMMVSMLSVVQRTILCTFGELNMEYLPLGETRTNFTRAFQVRWKTETISEKYTETIKGDFRGLMKGLISAKRERKSPRVEGWERTLDDSQQHLVSICSWLTGKKCHVCSYTQTPPLYASVAHKAACLLVLTK